MEAIQCIWEKDKESIKMNIPMSMLRDQQTSTDIARRFVGERAKIYDRKLNWTHTATLAELIMAGGCEYPFAKFRVIDIVRNEAFVPKKRESRCSDCGVPGPVDSRGLGWNCGCAAE